MTACNYSANYNKIIRVRETRILFKSTI